MWVQMGHGVSQNCCVRFLHSVLLVHNMPGKEPQSLPELCQHFRSTGQEVLTKRFPKAVPSQFILQSDRAGEKPRVRMGEDGWPAQ